MWSQSHSYNLVVDGGRYLLCTVGACYIRSKQTPAKDMLRDMVEMCKGVRLHLKHPDVCLLLRATKPNRIADGMPIDRGGVVHHASSSCGARRYSTRLEAFSFVHFSAKL